MFVAVLKVGVGFYDVCFGRTILGNVLGSISGNTLGRVLDDGLVMLRLIRVWPSGECRLRPLVSLSGQSAGLGPRGTAIWWKPAKSSEQEHLSGRGAHDQAPPAPPPCWREWVLSLRRETGYIQDGLHTSCQEIQDLPWLAKIRMAVALL